MDITTTQHRSRCGERRSIAIGVALAAVLTLGLGACAAAADGNPADQPKRHSPSPDSLPDPRPEPGQSEPSEPQVPAPPSQLVGRWNGGPGDSSDWYLTIGVDGDYTLINDWTGWTDSGLVDTSDNGFEVYNANGDGTVTNAAGINGCDWHIESYAGFTQLRFCGMASVWVPA